HALLFRIASEEPELSGISGQLHELVANCLTKEPEARPGLGELMARTEGEVAGAWLPGEVLAQLGRHAVQLLDSEDPETDGVGSGGSGGSGAAGVAGMTGGFMPSAPSAFSTPTPTPTPSTPPPVAPSTPLPSTPPPAVSTPPPSTPSTPPHGPMAGAYGPPAGSPYAPRQPWQQPPGQAAFQHGPGFAGTGPGPGPGIGPAAPPSSGALQRPVHSPRKLAQGVTVLLSLTLIMNVICLFVLGIVDASLSDTPSIIADTANLESVSGFYGLKSVTLTVEAISTLLGIPLIVLWLMWFWRVRVNAEAFAPGRIRLSSGTAVGAWFIPVCNLFMPKQVINDVWNASNPAVAPWYGHGPRPTSKRGLVNWWWVLWLLYFCFGSLSSYESWYDMDNVQAAQETNALALFVELLGIPATIVAMTFVNRLTSLQDGKLTGRG
ncbi:MAG TPA: DUF4328 domain-containing protein, partial [Streptomyces sp.]|nr:DUF4328 domain-containing protein [Streptomyces sp.]